MAERESEEHNIISDTNNGTIDTFYQTPLTPNKQGENANVIVPSEKIISSDVLSEALKVLMLQSTINDSTYYISDENDAEGDLKSNPLVDHTSGGNKIKGTDTDNTNKNSQQKLLFSWTLPIIIPPIEPQILDGVEAGSRTTHAIQTPTSKVILMDVARSRAHVLRTPGDVRWTGRYGTMPRDGKIP